MRYERVFTCVNINPQKNITQPNTMHSQLRVQNIAAEFYEYPIKFHNNHRGRKGRARGAPVKLHSGQTRTSAPRKYRKLV